MKFIKQFRSVLWFSIIASCVITSAVTWLFWYATGGAHVKVIIVFAFLFNVLVIYLLITFIYKVYFHRHLKDIYTGILKLRNNTNFNPDFNETDPALAINKILAEWSFESKEEIDHLKQIENYRRDFLSNVSHELKTPIFSIQGYVHTLIDGGIEDHDVNMLYLNKASRSIDRLINIVDDLESISKLEAGELIVEARTFDISDLAKEVIEMLEMQALERNVKLYIADQQEKPFYVYADKDLIRQVLVNLFFNSIKYGKPYGETKVTIRDSGELILVRVEDNGIGIEKHHLPRLFERFYRVDKSRSREQGGTGLGLAIVKHILEAHQQSITVESEFEKGTTFTFSLKKSK